MSLLGVRLKQFDAVVARTKPLGDGCTGELIQATFQYVSIISQLEKYIK